MLTIKEEDIEDDNNSESSMPEFGFDCKKNSNLRDFYEQTEKPNLYSYSSSYSNNKWKYGDRSQNKLGFVSDNEEEVAIATQEVRLDKIEDLNKAIESLDNTLFRSSLKEETLDVD